MNALKLSKVKLCSHAVFNHTTGIMQKIDIIRWQFDQKQETNLDFEHPDVSWLAFFVWKLCVV